MGRISEKERGRKTVPTIKFSDGAKRVSSGPISTGEKLKKFGIKVDGRENDRVLK